MLLPDPSGPKTKILLEFVADALYIYENVVVFIIIINEEGQL